MTEIEISPDNINQENTQETEVQQKSTISVLAHSEVPNQTKNTKQR